jgi:hypothetical protein
MAINASCLNQFKPFQYVETSLRVSPLFSMVASSLTDRNQSISLRSPSPALACFNEKITLMEVSSIDLPEFSIVQPRFLDFAQVAVFLEKNNIALMCLATFF